MNRRGFLAGLLAAAVAVAGISAEARMHAPYRGHRIVPANAAPLDGFTAPSGAYSFRRLRTAYAGSAVKLQRVDTTTQDIGFTAAGDFDTAAAATFCTTACTLNTLYDQSGNGWHLVQATAANQPAYVPNCVGTKPCFQTTAAQSMPTTPFFTPATGVASLSVVANRAVGTGTCGWLRENAVNNRLHGAAAGNWDLRGGTSGILPAPAADAAWHTGIGVINGASSSLTIDGATATGTVAGNVTAAQIAVVGAATTTCQWVEAALWDNYALTAPQIAALDQNQRAYWAPFALDTFTPATAAYSFRKLKSSYAGPAIRLRRASDNDELDINFLGCTGFTGCPWDEAAATAHCAATSCFIVTWYDQVGTRSPTNATAANQPALIFNCQGTLPCARLTGTQALTATATYTPTTGVISINKVMRRLSGAGNCNYRLNGNNSTLLGTVGAPFMLTNSGGNITATADANWHSLMGVANTASSSLNVDGAATAGTVGSVVTIGSNQLFAIAGTTCDVGEAMFWDNVVLTPAQIATLTANQRSFWGF